MNVQLFLLLTMLVSAVVGFISIGALLKMIRLAHGEAGLRTLYVVGLVYFVGLGLLTVGRLAGEASPIPFQVLVDADKLTYYQALVVWMHFCVSAAAACRAYIVTKAPLKTPEGRAYCAALQTHNLNGRGRHGGRLASV